MALINIPNDYQDSPDRALHNLYCERRTTLHPMTAVPIYFRRMFPGDKFDIGIAESYLQSQPTFAPLMANWKLRFEWYFDSDANRYGWKDNNTRLSSEEIMGLKHHNFTFEPLVIDDMIYDSDLVGRGSVMEYAGFPAGFKPVENDSIRPKFSLDFFLTYLNIIRNYHCNRQFTSIPYIASDTDGNWQFREYKASDMDNLFMALRSCENGITFALNQGTWSGSTIPSWITYNEDYERAFNELHSWLFSSLGNSCGGLFCTQFAPDLFQNLLNKDQSLLRSEVVVQNGHISIENFRLSNHAQHLYDLLFVAGGRNKDTSRTRWGISSNRQYDIPEIISAYSEIIGTNLITSNNAGSNGDIQSTPGDFAGNINSKRGGSRLQKFTATEHGNLMCLVTLTPIVDYCQNIQHYLRDIYFEDEYNPQMARKGFEDIPVSDYCALPNYSLVDDGESLDRYVRETDLDISVGKQVAWLREMTDTNRVFGEFSYGGTQEDWVLVRKFARERNNRFQFDTFSPYGNPLEFQYPFVSQSLKDPNFYLQVGIICKAYRPIGRRYMPTIGV